MSEELVSIAYEFSPLKANLIRSRLEADGIECFVEGESVTSVAGPFSHATASWKHPTANLELKVRRNDAPRAREILSEISEPSEPGIFEQEQSRENRSGKFSFFLVSIAAAALLAIGTGVVAEMYLGSGQIAAALILLVPLALILKKLFNAE